MTLKETLSGLIKPFLRSTRVAGARFVAERFRLIELAGGDLTGLRASPGDKLQVLVQGEFRTYSPFAVDASAASMSLLAFTHDQGPGARWARAVEAGAPLHVFGPRGSLPLGSVGDGAVFVGDETSLGVARSLTETARPEAIVLEVEDVVDARAAADAIGLEGVHFIERSSADAHVEALVMEVIARARADRALVLSGRAQTIQAVRAALKREGVHFAAQHNKAYWAPGKRGLD